MKKRETAGRTDEEERDRAMLAVPSERVGQFGRRGFLVGGGGLQRIATRSQAGWREEGAGTGG